MRSLKAILASNMKVYRNNLGISQAQLAERVNTATSYIAMIETQKKYPSFEMLERIAKGLEIEPAALFATENHPHTKEKRLSRIKKQMLKDVNSAVSEILNAGFDQYQKED
jgi:transcriptional regulator with XRE-family HTH domain